jgi:hypothetical protein
MYKHRNMTAHGYHWCDNCDENTFAAKTCPTCQNPTRFIATEPDPEPPISRPISKPAPASQASAADWFRRMREALAAEN